MTDTVKKNVLFIFNDIKSTLLVITCIFYFKNVLNKRVTLIYG